MLAIPAAKAIRESSAYANAYNTINAALQAARSYAIMNKITTAVRFERFNSSSPKVKRKIELRYDSNDDGDYDDSNDLVSTFKPLYLPIQYTVDDNSTPTTSGGTFDIEYLSSGVLKFGTVSTIYLYRVVNDSPDSKSQEVVYINRYTGRIIQKLR